MVLIGKQIFIGSGQVLALNTIQEKTSLLGIHSLTLKDQDRSWFTLMLENQIPFALPVFFHVNFHKKITTFSAIIFLILNFSLRL